MDICEYNKQYNEVLLVPGYGIYHPPQRQIQVLDIVQTTTNFTVNGIQYHSQWKGIFESSDFFNFEEYVYIDHSKFKGTVIITQKNGRYYSFVGIKRLQWKK